MELPTGSCGEPLRSRIRPLVYDIRIVPDPSRDGPRNAPGAFYPMANSRPSVMPPVDTCKGDCMRLRRTATESDNCGCCGETSAAGIRTMRFQGIRSLRRPRSHTAGLWLPREMARCGFMGCATVLQRGVRRHGGEWTTWSRYGMTRVRPHLRCMPRTD